MITLSIFRVQTKAIEAHTANAVDINSPQNKHRFSIAPLSTQRLVRFDAAAFWIQALANANVKTDAVQRGAQIDAVREQHRQTIIECIDRQWRSVQIKLCAVSGEMRAATSSSPATPQPLVRQMPVCKA